MSSEDSQTRIHCPDCSVGLTDLEAGRACPMIFVCPCRSCDPGLPSAVCACPPCHAQVLIYGLCRRCEAPPVHRRRPRSDRASTRPTRRSRARRADERERGGRHVNDHDRRAARFFLGRFSNPSNSSGWGSWALDSIRSPASRSAASDAPTHGALYSCNLLPLRRTLRVYTPSNSRATQVASCVSTVCTSVHVHSAYLRRRQHDGALALVSRAGPEKVAAREEIPVHSRRENPGQCRAG